MSQFTQFGRPVQIVVTGGPTITDLMSCECTYDPELNEHFGGSLRFPRITVGNDNTRIRIRTSDIAALACVKGREYSSIVATFEATATAVGADGSITKASANTIGMTIAPVRCVAAFQIGNEANGEPGEIECEFRASALEADGTAATITFDVSFAS